MEMVSTMVHQLTANLSMEEIEKSGFSDYYVDHTVGVWPQAAGGVPLNANQFQSKGDPITDLFETESPHHLRQYPSCCTRYS